VVVVTAVLARQVVLVAAVLLEVLVAQLIILACRALAAELVVVVLYLVAAAVVVVQLKSDKVQIRKTRAMVETGFSPQLREITYQQAVEAVAVTQTVTKVLLALLVRVKVAAVMEAVQQVL
jgi:hypothetical protein